VEESLSHYFIYDKAKNPDIPKYALGKMHIKGKKLVKSLDFADTITFVEDIQKTINVLPKDNNGIIIYIHGYQADNIYFMQQSGYVLQQNIFDSPQHTFGLVISLQWNSVLIYDHAVQNAYKKGQNFVALLQEIYAYHQTKHPSSKIAFLCHSMGNRVFQGIYNQWIKLNPTIKLDIVMMMAADIEYDIFTDGFPNIGQHIQKLYVFHHLVDKTLLMANALKPHPRLGIFGPKENTILGKNILVKDATAIVDDESFAGKITNHRYYYGSPTVRQEIVNILKNK
jgi:esterase/lipase superfamily enzyme